MTVSRPVIVGLIVAVLVAVAAWLLLKPGDAASQSTGSEQTPVDSRTNAAAARPATTTSRTAQDSESTAQVAGAGNAAAVPGSGLDMHTLASCRAALQAKKFAERQANCDDIPPSDSVSLKLCREQQAEMAQEVQKTTAAAASCPGDLGSASAYYDAMKSLALRGDVAAQRCFIQGYFSSGNSEGDDIRLKKEQIEEYPAIARKFIDDAFERGDWSVVRWLGRITLTAGDTMLSEAYPFGGEHLDTAYRMAYLLNLGHKPGTRGDDPGKLAEYYENQRMISAEQIKEGQRWAHEMFDQHFNGSQEGADVTEYNFCDRR